MDVVINALEQGLLFALVAMGVYITYKILDFPDLSVDGTFPLGASISAALLINGVNPWISILIATIGGAIAGSITGFLHVKLKISNLMSGILVMMGLYSVNLRIMGKSNIPLFSVKHLFNGNVSAIVVVAVILLIVKLGMGFLLKTKFGFALKALGDNESLIISLGLNEKTLKIYGLMLANSLVALSGAVLAQYQGFADVGMGTGTIITGLASIIIGDALFGKKKVIKISMMVIFGTIIYRTIIALSLKVGMNASDLKLITSALVVIIIFLKEKKHLLKKGGIVNA